MSPEMPVRRAQQSNISIADPLALTVARRWVKERREARVRASYPQWNCESPWLELNRCMAREEWTRPTHAWIAQQL
jgi:hypothetical protein